MANPERVRRDDLKQEFLGAGMAQQMSFSIRRNNWDLALRGGGGAASGASPARRLPYKLVDP